ncbi:MAG: tetratricopeptide repeat protein [Stagnimonas sp.]|nr:tetratricopeptide repeat protein [Stagnimonas sp.]
MKRLGVVAAATICLVAVAAVAAEASDCGHPVAQRSILACSLLIERGGALPERRAELLVLRGTAYTIKGDSDAATKDLDEAIRLNPGDADAFFARGGAHFKKGAYDQAMADFDHASWLNPDHLGAYVGRGVVYKMLGKDRLADGDPAFGAFRKSAFEGSGDRQQLNESYWRRVEYTFKLLDDAIRRNPNDADAYTKRANAFRNLGRRQYDRALADYDQAIDRDKKHLKAHAWRAVVRHAKGQYDLAIADLDQVIRARPNLGWPLQNRAVVWVQKGDYDRAIADLTKAIRVETSKPPLGLQARGVDLYARRGLAYERKGDREKAIADYRTIVALWPSKSTSSAILESVERLKRLGADLSDFALFDEAQQVARFTQLIRDYPKNEDHYRSRCGAYLKSREYDNAVADCDRAIELTSAQPYSSVLASLNQSKLAVAFNQRGLAYRNKGELERAIHDFDEAIRLEPSTAEYYHNRGDVLVERGDYERAFEDYRLAIRLNPNVPEYYDSRGRPYERKGEQDKATAHFDKAREIRQSTPKDILLAPSDDR